MKTEQKYAFRKYYCQPHKRIYGFQDRTPTVEEYVLKDGITIGVGGLETVGLLAAEDFVDYLRTAFGIRAALTQEKGDISICVSQEGLEEACGYMGRKITVSDHGIFIQGYDQRGVAQGLYSLEDRMNARRAPFLKKGVVEQIPEFSPRMIHSALDVDAFPDDYLNVCAHHGYDAILVFARDSHHGAYKNREYDFNDLVRRAAHYGIDVYIYSYMKNYVHPSEENAKESYSNAYAQIFRDVPGLKGIVFVGESSDFPSRDPDVTHQLTVDGIPTGKMRPGWWPCVDYPEWICMVRDCIHEAAPEAEIVFWTYNFGRAPEEKRVKFIEAMPEGVTLLVTFNHNHPLNLGSTKAVIRDYSLLLAGQSTYFQQEAAAAKKRNIRLYSMVNTAGRTWDFGTAPYEPYPWQWNTLHQEIKKAKQQYGLCGLMESHHYGFVPSFISLQAKEAFTRNGTDFDTYIRTWAKNLAPEDHKTLLEGMRLVNESVQWFTPSVENQYGPYRIGPAYPLCLQQTLIQPSDPESLWGNIICRTYVQHEDTPRQDPYSLRRLDEIKRLKQARDLNLQGLRKLKTIRKRTAELEKLINLVEYLYRCHVTALHVKDFSILKEKLMIADSWEKLEALADKIERIARKEIENTEKTIPLAQRDSAIGYEPSMGYMCDEAALRWKLRQMEYMLTQELPNYRRR